MKNLAKFFAIFTAAILLGGCTFSDFFAVSPPEKIEKKSKIISAIGEIEAREISLFGGATHNLRDENGEIIFTLESKVEDLSAFEGERVKITAQRVDEKTVDENLVSVLTIENLNAADAAPQKFQLAKNGIEITLPAEWSKKIENGKTIFTRENDELLQKSPQISVGEIFADTEIFTEISEKIADENLATKIFVAANEAFRVEKSGGVEIYFPRERKVDEKTEKYFLKIALAFGAESDDDQIIFAQMLDDLVFTAKKFEIETDEKCGGSQNKLCDDGFRCEISADETEGICVLIDENLQIDDDENLQTKSSLTAESCAMDVKVCDDGSVVSRDLENDCQFFSCPTADDENLENEISDENLDDENSNENSDEKNSETQNSAREISAPKSEFYAIESAALDFTISAPKNYFWQNFGAQNGAQSFIGLADAEMENAADAIISIAVFSAGATAGEKTVGENLEITVALRENESLKISGQQSFAEVLRGIATSAKLK